MTPLIPAVIFAAPAMFPGLHPVAVWLGCGCIALAVWATLKADELGHSEGTLRAEEAREWLRMMDMERVG